MANILDYLDWRGDISFENDPFNEVDNLVLSWLSYVELDDVMPKGVCNVEASIGEVAERFFKKCNLEDELKKHSLTRTSALLFDKLKDCERFSKIKIKNYVNDISEEKQLQFSAMTIELTSDFIYVAFRGTDDTIVGWREDFNMSFLPIVPAQEKAVKYLNRSLNNYTGKVVLGGHSKGGNLAVYAGIHCKKQIKDNIINIYNNDGPGFLENTTNSKEYQDMLPKIITIVPESSVIGMLLGHSEKYAVVKSTQKGIMQHEADSWEVERNKFVYVNSVSQGSKFMDTSITAWIQELSEDERKVFVDALFRMLEAAGAKTTGELYELGFKNIAGAIKTFNNMSSDMKQMLINISMALLNIIKDNLKSQIIK